MLEKDSSLVSFKPPGQPRGAYVGTDPEHPYLNKWAKIAEVSEQNRFDLAAGLQAATEDYMRKLFSKFLDVAMWLSLIRNSSLKLNL